MHARNLRNHHHCCVLNRFSLSHSPACLFAHMRVQSLQQAGRQAAPSHLFVVLLIRPIVSLCHSAMRAVPCVGCLHNHKKIDFSQQKTVLIKLNLISDLFPPPSMPSYKHNVAFNIRLHKTAILRAPCVCVHSAVLIRKSIWICLPSPAPCGTARSCSCTICL
jgi:hypothetical protein